MKRKGIFMVWALAVILSITTLAMGFAYGFRELVLLSHEENETDLLLLLQDGMERRKTSIRFHEEISVPSSISLNGHMYRREIWEKEVSKDGVILREVKVTVTDEAGKSLHAVTWVNP